ncbi:MAG: tetratricopeptide repeat protein [Pseudomonadota bacterium]
MRLIFALLLATATTPALAFGTHTEVICGLYSKRVTDSNVTINCNTINEESLAKAIADLLSAEGAPTLSDRLLINLAKRVAADQDITDLNQAALELERAIDTVLAMEQEGVELEASSEFVSEVFARMRALRDEGDLDAASDLLAQAEADMEAAQAEMLNNRIALMNQHVSIHVLRRDAEAAAAKLVEREILVTPDPSRQLDALRRETTIWRDRGRDFGSRIDLEVAIALSEATLPLAKDDEETGIIFNDLGASLTTLGKREQNTDRLNEAVDAYRAALQVSTREALPVQWATTQNNLGIALQSLGERDQNTDRLNDAVDAYHAALQVTTREALPVEWAMIQNNLGIALQTLGERKEGTDRLNQAVAAYRAALRVRTREALPVQWAMTQNNLGTALQTLGERENSTARHSQAVEAYRAALQVYTREASPVRWATTQNNLGTVLRNLGQREQDTVRLNQALEAYRAALQVRTREALPADWAATQNNLGNALQNLGQLIASNELFIEAVEAFSAALQVYTHDASPVLWATTQNNLGIVLRILGEREQSIDRLTKAVEAYSAALQVRTREAAPINWAVTRYNMAFVHVEKFEISGVIEELGLAEIAVRDARSVFEVGSPLYVSYADRLLSRISGLRTQD